MRKIGVDHNKHHQKLPRDECTSHGSHSYGRATRFDNLTFYGYIQVLLIKTDSMVYKCYIKYKI